MKGFPGLKLGWSGRRLLSVEGPDSVLNPSIFYEMQEKSYTKFPYVSLGRKVVLYILSRVKGRHPMKC